MSIEETAILALADGRVFRGSAFGALGKIAGEVVFNTSMSGYQEILTDPSYDGQIVVMTYPEIGNVGVNAEDIESFEPFVKGFAVKEYWDRPSNFRAQMSLGAYMKEHDIVGIQGIDTRALVRHVRDQGAQQAVLVSGDAAATPGAEQAAVEQALVAEAAARPTMAGMNLASGVSCDERYRWVGSTWKLGEGYDDAVTDGPLVVAMDFGMKLNIARNLIDEGCRVVVVPADATADEIRALGPDGLFLSNGPGDPAPVAHAVETVATLSRELPTFGICLGHQILSLALGATTYKMKFGHHGGNQPVLTCETGVVEITSQNLGFAVDEKSLPDALQITHINLNDRSVEGVQHKELPIFSVQYHPEASPGPHDAHPLFRRFVESLPTAPSGRVEIDAPAVSDRTLGA